MPNITGERHANWGWLVSTIEYEYSGAIYPIQTQKASGTGHGNEKVDASFGIDAGASNSIYGKSEIVQPSSIRVLNIVRI